MITFYKIENNQLQVGHGTVIPDGFIEYTVGQEPEEFKEALALEAIEQARTSMNNAIQQLLDQKAQEYRYDNMMSTRSYAGYENPYQAEAQSLAVWASNCWVKAGEIEAEVLSGARPMPTVEDVLAEMPVFEGYK